ncbi:MAG: carboxypeptidase-like regulatory domain-containing protein [Flavobacteriales bacterium]|nr:carboxypeptidase-like regulatory domain-containing protein [Flavobacteriales bacterium]
MKRVVSILFVLLSLCAQSQTKSNPTSAIRGTVVDQQSQFPLPGVNIILLNQETTVGTTTDIDGNFRLENVPVGRQAIQVSYIGYEPQVLNNLLVSSGKDLEVNISLSESIINLEGAEIVADDNKAATINEMSTVSARTISIEEAQRYSGSLLDPARMAQNYAGVSSASDDRNDIIIRGNSPTGVLWRMEGIDIPSPNHFGTLGTTGGPVSMLNINNLANSDFLTSAFAPEYGNALAGVFDLRLRNGNKDKFEFLGQIGFNGLELGAEGPLGIGNKSSFIVNYRYSTLGIFQALGIDFGTGDAVPEYQDLTFKMDIPTRKLGRFGLFGVGGISFVEFKASDSEETNLFSNDAEDSQFESTTGWVGLSHQYFIGENTQTKLVLATSFAGVDGWIDSLSTIDGDPHRVFGLKTAQGKYSGNFSVNHKFNARHTVKAGVIFDRYDFVLEDSVLWQADEFFYRSDFHDQADLLQSYISWQSRVGQLTTVTAGVHSLHFLFNNTNAFEPRLGVKFNVAPDQYINLGAGLHSQLQPIPVYFRQHRLPDGSTELRNNNLGFNKSAHLVLGYDNMITPQFRIKSEVYYQYLYDIAVDNDSSSFSMLNSGVDFGIPSNSDLVNEGTGYNYGLEFTAERFFHQGWYGLVTVSLFTSRYAGSDGIERNTAFNGNYVTNVLAGKEWSVGKRALLGVDTKFTYAGGRRYTPIDLEASALAGQEVRPDNLAFSEQYNPYLRWDLKLSFRFNGKSISQQWALDLRNVTGHRNIFIQQYNARNNTIQNRYQIGFFPVVLWNIYF